MSEPSHRRKLWAGTAAGFVAVVAVLGFAWSFTAPLPAPTASPSAHDAVVAAPEPSPQDDQGSVLRVEAGNHSEEQQPGVYGRLLDNHGQPLVGFALRLSIGVRGSSGESAWLGVRSSDLLLKGGSYEWGGLESRDTVTSGPNGEFAFRGAVAGDYQLLTVPFGVAARPVTLAKNERLQVSFQLTENEVATTGQVFRSGEVQKSLKVLLREGEHWQWFASAGTGDGVYRFVLPAGENTLGVVAPRSLVRPRVPCGQRRFVVPQNQPRLDWIVVLACVDLVVFTRDERGMLPEGAQVTVRSLEKDTMATNKLSLPVATKGTQFRFLPPGDYEVRVAGKGLARVPVQKLTVAAVNDREELHFVVARATTVKLLAKSAGKELQTLPAGCMPVLRLGDFDYPYRRIDDYGDRYSGRVYGFQNHPPGNAVIVAKDRIVDGESQFLAFDPLPDQFVQALLDQPNELTLTVTRRALVDLRACESGGREQFSASIEVFAGEQKVRSLPTKFWQRFRSYLPPGDYRVVIDRGGARSERKLKVARRDIRLRLRP